MQGQRGARRRECSSARSGAAAPTADGPRQDGLSGLASGQNLVDLGRIGHLGERLSAICRNSDQYQLASQPNELKLLSSIQRDETDQLDDLPR
jgi:hypothetical protein